MQLNAGDRLGPYEIESLLGAGGMGEVYRARDPRLDRVVAVKVLPARSSDNAESRQRFEREARAISSLTHPHICTIYDVGEIDGRPYLVMEHLEGETLADRIARGPIPPSHAARYGAEICEALDAAHRQHIVHRDLKPGNVMITKSGIKLLDFGLAKLRSAQAATISGNEPTIRQLPNEGMILGTLQCMAPEQVEGKEADARTDIFAAGVVMYEMVTGRRPFSGGSQASVAAAIVHTDPPPMTTQPALERIIRPCLATVVVSTAAGFSAGRPVELFERRIPPFFATMGRSYDVGPDGRFMFVEASQEQMQIRRIDVLVGTKQ